MERGSVTPGSCDGRMGAGLMSGAAPALGRVPSSMPAREVAAFRRARSPSAGELPVFAGASAADGEGLREPGGDEAFSSRRARVA